MGGLSDDIKKVEANLKRIAGYYEDLNENNPFSGANAQNIANSVEEMQKLEDAVKGAATRVKEIDTSLESLVTRFKSANNEIKTGSEGLKSMNQILSQQANSAERVKNHQEGISILSIKQLQKEKDKIKSAQSRLSIAKELLEQEKQQLLEKLKTHSLTTSEFTKLNKIKGALQVNAQLASKKNKDYESIISTLDDEIAKEKEIQKGIGITGGILKGISKIPILGDIFDANEAVQTMTNHLREGGNALGAFKAGMSNLKDQIIDGMLNPANMALFAFTFILDTLKGMDKSAGELAKGMNVSYRQGVELNKELRDIAVSSHDTMINSKGLQESLLAINKSMGTNVMVSKENLKTFTKLRETAGLTNDELMGSMKLTASNGKSLKKNIDTILKTTSSLNKQSGIYLNEKDILKDIDKISSATTLSLGQNPEHLAKAAATAKRFGIEMSQLEGIADSMLNFESSISNELEAELLLGKDLTLEKARQAALNNDMATLAEEVAKQAGSAAEFGKMNRIQQEAVAKAVGMNRDSLGQTLFVQEQLKGLSKDEGERREELLQKRIGEVGLAQAQRELEEGGIENLEAQASAAEKFEKTVEKIKEIFANMIDGPLGGVLKIIEKVLSSSTAIYGITGMIAGVYGGKMIAGIASTITKIVAMTAANTANAAAATTAATATSFGTMIPVILAGVGAIMGMVYGFAKGNDVFSPGGSGGGYGNRTLFGPEGAISLNNKDTVIAGTNLFGDDVKSEPGKATEMAGKGEIQVKGGGDMSAVISAINTLSGNLNAIASRPIEVSIDGNKVITATTDQKPNETGGAIRKNSYQVQ